MTEFNSCLRLTVDRRHGSFLVPVKALREQMLRLGGFGCLDLPGLHRHLFSHQLVPAEKRFERIHQEHLDAHQLGEDTFRLRDRWIGWSP